MKLIICLTVLVALTNATFLENFAQSLTNVGHALAQSTADVAGAALGGAFNVGQALKDSTTSLLSNFLATTHLLQLGQPDASTVQKRKSHPDGHLSVDQVLREGSAAVEQVLHHYADQLQALVNQVQSADFLHGNVAQFLHNLQSSHEITHQQLEAIKTEVYAALAHALHHGQKRDLLASLSGLFTQTVGQASSLLDNVHNALNSTSGGLLGAVVQHVQHLGDTLSGLKDTAASLLASGQEGLASLTGNAHDLLHQAHTGLQGAASQTLDTLLHPQGTK